MHIYSCLRNSCVFFTGVWISFYISMCTNLYSRVRYLRSVLFVRSKYLCIYTRRREIFAHFNSRAKFVRSYSRAREICDQSLWILFNNRSLCLSVRTRHPPDAGHSTFSRIILVNMPDTVYICVSASGLFIYTLFFSLLNVYWNVFLLDSYFMLCLWRRWRWTLISIDRENSWSYMVVTVVISSVIIAVVTIMIVVLKKIIYYIFTIVIVMI